MFGIFCYRMFGNDMAHNENPKATKDLILETAFSFFNDKRYTAFSMNELAAKLGISKPAIYRHFKNKDALLDAMENHIVTNMSELVKDVGSKNPETTKKSLAGIIRYFIKNPAHINYYIAQISQRANYEESLFQKMSARNVAFLRENNGNYIRNFKSDMRLLARYVFCGMSLFYFVKMQERLRFMGKIPKTPDDFADNVVSILMNGISGTTDKDDPVHPVEIPESRRGEIINLCRIHEDFFPAENKIFTALAAVIEKHTMAGVTVERIAGELNMAKSSLYEYFDNKNEMIKTLLDKELSLLHTIVNENISEARNFTECIMIQMYSELEYFMHRPSIIPICGWILMSRGGSADTPGQQDEGGYNFWEKQLPERIISPNLGFSYTPGIITNWVGVLPMAFLFETRGKNLKRGDFMEGFNFMTDYIFNGIKEQEE